MAVTLRLCSIRHNLPRVLIATGSLSPPPATTCRTSSSSAAEHPLERSRRLGRPLSPFISIYRFPVPSVFSFAHRVSGAVLSIGLYGAVVGYVGSGMTFQEVYSAAEALPPLVLLGGKFIIAWPFCYHAINGCRHLVWDVGYGLGSMRAVYVSGYTVFLLSLLAALGVAYYKH